MTHKSEDYKNSAVKYYLKYKDNIRINFYLLKLVNHAQIKSYILV